MNKNISKILKEKIKRIQLTNQEFFWKFNKSVTQNNNINNNIRLYSQLQFTKKLKKIKHLSKKHKICLYTGNYNGILKGFNFSRYQLKKLILNNKLTNLKKHNW